MNVATAFDIPTFKSGKTKVVRFEGATHRPQSHIYVVFINVLLCVSKHASQSSVTRYVFIA